MYFGLQEGIASQADKLAQLQQQGQHLQESAAAAHTRDDHALQKQRQIFAAAEEEVIFWLPVAAQDLYVDSVTRCLHLLRPFSVLTPVCCDLKCTSHTAVAES